MKAFPNPHRTDELGMTLRDYLAAQAMPAIRMTASHPSDYEAIAKYAYQMADAMLKAREA